MPFDWIEYSKEYHKTHYDQICYKVRKELRLKERIRTAAELHQQTSAQYAINAILSALDRDGITLDSLPPPPDQTESVKQD